jgi:hypothetical protein
MGGLSLLFQRSRRIPSRLYREVRIWIVSLPRLWWANRYGRAPIREANGPVVSLTTHGVRVRTVYLTIESIARGYKRPSRIILWVEDEELSANLPQSLLRLKRRGLEIRSCRNYGPHKKYYPYLESQEVFAGPLATADDDVIYPRYWLSGLFDAHKEFPTCVNCYRARVMTLQNGSIAPYREWPLCNSSEPRYRTVATGESGIIYPSTFLTKLKTAGNRFESCCPKADDLWLHVQALRAGYKIRQLRSKALDCLQVPGSQGIALGKENYDAGGNDRQVEATYTAADIKRVLED